MQIAVTPDQYATYHPEGIAAREAAEAAEFTFLDLVDVVNPLQHIPVVNMVYREATGDIIKGPAMIVGGFLYGGPVGMGAGMINAVAQEATGGTISDHVLDGVFGGERVRAVSRQDLYAMFGDPAPAPGTADLLATAQRAPTPEELRARTAEIAAIARGLPGAGGAADLPTHAELDARTAQVAAAARQLAAGGSPATQAGTMASADTVAPPAAPLPTVPPPPNRPGATDPLRLDTPATGAQVAAAPAPAETIVTPLPEPAVVEPAGTTTAVPALALALPELASGPSSAQTAEAAPVAGSPPPPEAFMALPARVPTTTSRMTLATSAGIRPTPSVQPASSWVAQEIAATLAAPPTPSPSAAATDPADGAARRMDESRPAAGSLPGSDVPVQMPTSAVPAAMMRNLDAYRTMAQSAG